MGGDGAADGAPLGGDAVAEYHNPDDGDRASDATGGWAPTHQSGTFLGGRPPCGSRSRPAVDEAGAYDDGFAFRTSFRADDRLSSFDIPRRILRPDGLPMTFTPCDPVHSATFTSGSRDELEARQWYCSLAWTQSIYNDLLAAQHADGNTKELFQELVNYLVCATRRVYALEVTR